MSIAYNRINWENKPSTQTKINAANLNKMDKGIDDLVNAINDTENLTAGKLALYGSIAAVDKTPYSKRDSLRLVGASDFFYDEIVGGSVGWNQLVQNGNFVDTSNWTASGTFTVADNIGRFRASNAYGNLAQTINNFPSSHNILLCATIKSYTNSNTKFRFIEYNSNNVASATDINLSATRTTIKKVLKTKNDTVKCVISIQDANSSNFDDIEVSNVCIYDLSLMFGSTIADYIYNLEQGESGSGYAVFKALFPKDYYAYDSGSLQSVNVSAHKTYDENDNVIGNYALDSSLTLKGLYKLDENNKLYCDGDVYESDGTVTRKYGIVDLGSLSWGYNSTDLFFYTNGSLSSAKYPSNNSVVANMISTKFITVARNSFITDKQICMNDAGVLLAKDSSYTDAQAFTTSLNGVYLLYELATPTTESATPYTELQTYDKDGSEEYVDYAVFQNTRDVAIPCGHNSKYLGVGDEALELPPLPTSDGDYVLNLSITSGIASFSWVANV